MAIRQVGPVARAALIGIALPAIASAQSAIPLKEAKLNIEHNATDHDTGFQGAIVEAGHEDDQWWPRQHHRLPAGRREGRPRRIPI